MGKVQNRSVAKLQIILLLFFLLITTRSLGAPDVNSIDNNQSWKKKPAVGSQPGSILTFQNLRLTSLCNDLNSMS